MFVNSSYCADRKFFQYFIRNIPICAIRAIPTDSSYYMIGNSPTVRLTVEPFHIFTIRLLFHICAFKLFPNL